MRYLQRYAAPAEHLKRLLLHKVRRSAELHGTDAEMLAGFVGELLGRLEAAGVLSDRRFAEGKAMSLRRRGGSGRHIRALLAAKGVSAEEAERALALADDGAPADDAELAAARALARRRRLGPWRVHNRREHSLKDLAALGRAGFSYETARAVIDGTGED